MGGDSQESPQASSYCMIDTPGKEKKKPLAREEDLPSAEESEEKEGEGEEKEGEERKGEEGEGEEKEEQKNEQEGDQKSIKLVNEYHSEQESIEEETSQIQNNDDREIEMAEHMQKVHEQAKADQAAEENKSQIELGTDTDHENDDKKEERNDNLQSPRSKTDDDEMKSAISHKSEATVISGRTENTKEAPLRNIGIGEIGRRGRRRDPIA